MYLSEKDREAVTRVHTELVMALQILDDIASGYPETGNKNPNHFRKAVEALGLAVMNLEDFTYEGTEILEDEPDMNINPEHPYS
jgi:hypothetical protein